MILTTQNTFQDIKEFSIRASVVIIGSVVILLTFSMSITAQESYSFKHITSIEGLSNNTVHDIVQDYDGYIWIATIEGLNKFDGKNVTSYYSDSTTVENFSNIILKLIVGSNGKMLVGTTNGLNVYNKNIDSFTPLLFENKSIPWIIDMIELSDESIIISTVDGLFKFYNNVVSKIKDGNFHSIERYDNDWIWAATNNEIQLIDNEGRIVKTYNNSSHRNRIDFTTENIVTIYRDSRNIVWLGTSKNGLAYYDAIHDKFLNLRLKDGINDLEDNFIRSISEDKDGLLWIGTESGLYTYDIVNQAFNFYGQNFNLADEGLTDKAIYSIYRDRDNIMWLGTFFGGVNYTDPAIKGFKKIYADGGFRKLSGNALSNIIETKDGRIWIATEDGGISILNRTDNSFEYIKHKEGKRNTLSSNNVHALLEDNKGVIWIGTFLGGINRYDIKTKSVEPAQSDPRLKDVFSLEKDSKNRIWAATLIGLFRKDNKVFEEVLKGTFENKFLRHVNEDNNGNIWICSNFFGIYVINKNNEISNFNVDNTPELINNMIVYSFEDSNSDMWFGTQEGGLIRYEQASDNFTVFTVEDGLPNNTVYSVNEDEQGNIWCATTKGLSKYNPKTNIFTNFDEYDGLVGNQFNHASSLRAKDGTLFFGAVNGLTYFNPENIHLPIKEVNLHLTDFKLFNKSVKVEKDGILNRHIDDVEEITLNYSDNVFTIDFLNINFSTPKKIQYSYYLEGFEKEWNYVNSKSSATYTNLSPGSYTFKLRATTGNGVWTKNTKTLKIIVKPPFWMSVWGYLTYFVVVMILTASYIRYSRIRSREKLSIQLAKHDKEKNEEINAHRMNFFTYISHEFKTPLSIVIATIEEIMSEGDSSSALKQYGNTIKKNAYKLLQLINQLMDFRKIETDHESIKINNGDVILFIRSIVDSFEPLFEKKSVEVIVNSNTDSYESYFDADKLEKIISNILSNSYKVFDEDGLIKVNLEVIEEDSTSTLNNGYKSKAKIVIMISDDGPGMSEKKLSKLFDPFYTVNSDNNFSSGIGLTLVNSLIKLLDGTIDVSSKENIGSNFKLTIPLIKASSNSEDSYGKFVDKISNTSLKKIISDLDNYDYIENSSPEKSEMKSHEMLIVEDNKDLSSFLNNHFSKLYKTRVANNGLVALQKIEKSQPDIIISDIMMPKMDGNELCNTLKGAVETSHIPIILLTAKSGEVSKIEGLSKGADGYINKPFNLKELDYKVRNILKSIDDNKMLFAKFDTLDDSVKTLQNSEAQFVRNLTGVIFQNIDNSEFHINELCKEVFISRPHLHRKLKKTTGLSTSEFIRKVRLNEAKKLLKTGMYTVAEVATKVGYDDSAYFSKSFKKVFNELPSTFIKKQEF